MAANDLTAERLRSLLDYNPETGLFTWRVRRSARANAGTIAGYQAPSGYVLISVDGFMHAAHRLAWLHFYGTWPTKQIDHHDEIKHNNRIRNLRDLTRAENAQNITAARINNACGERGIYIDHRRNTFIVQITVDYKRVFLKSYGTMAEAKAAYEKAKIDFHPASRAPLI